MRGTKNDVSEMADMNDLTNEDRAIIRYALRAYGSKHVEFATAAAQKGARDPHGNKWPQTAISNSLYLSKRAFELIAEFQSMDERAKPEHGEG